MDSDSILLAVTIPSGFILKHYDIPLITYASNNPVVSNKHTYSTVVRIGAGYKQIGLAFVEVCEIGCHENKWQKRGWNDSCKNMFLLKRSFY